MSKRSLLNILADVGVGVCTFKTGLDASEAIYDASKNPVVIDYIGGFGAGMMEYGLSAIAFAGTLWLSSIAVIATDYFMRKGHLDKPLTKLWRDE